MDRQGASALRGCAVKRNLLLIGMLLACAFALHAQSVDSRADPGEPEIVMPQVILEIEDLSVEKVEATLPPEEELLPPERRIPVLSEGELALGDPKLPPGVMDIEQNAGLPRDRFLASEIDLGAGMQNRIVGSISLKTIGPDPRFSLSFNHETLDGFAGFAPGSGYSARTDALDGTLKFGLGPVAVDLGGRFTEAEAGLQGQSAFVARLARSLAAEAGFSGNPAEWLTFTAGIGGGTDSLTLEGSAPVSLSGFSIAPSLSAIARFGPLKVGLDSRYAFRSDPSTVGGQLHRFQADASLAVDLPPTYILEARGGWFWNSAGLSLVPFHIGFTGTPFEFLTLSLAIGYRVAAYDLRDAMAAGTFVLPSALADDRGWFADTALQFTITRELSAGLKLSFMADEAMPRGSASRDTLSGLFLLDQAPGVRLGTDAGLRWGITSALSLSAGWTHEFLDRPFFAPLDTVKAELLALEPAGRLGGSISLVIAPTFSGMLQQPLLRLAGFWKVSDAVKLQLDADDLLWPLLAAPRMDIPPFVTQGFRITGRVGIAL
jgi:hypothetical protein